MAATATTTWITINDALKQIDIGRVRLDQLRVDGWDHGKRRMKVKRKTTGRKEITHVLAQDVLDYIEYRDSDARRRSSHAVGIATRGSKRPHYTKPESRAPKRVIEDEPVVSETPVADSLIAFGDAWQIPPGRTALIINNDGVERVDAARVLII